MGDLTSYADDVPSVPLLEEVDRALAELAPAVRLLAAVTPANARAESQRLRAAFAAGGEALPRWRYAVPPEPPLAGLERLARLVRTCEGRLVGLYGERIAELILEARMIEAVGTPTFGGLARERFRVREADDPAADELAARWRTAAPPDRGPLRPTDGDDERCLVPRMRRELARHGLSFEVRVVADLASLAATGARAIYVASGRSVSDRVARRTVLHEVHGHAMPRARARGSPLRLLGAGTAGAHDQQEGLALLLEERGRLLDPSRRAELARRHGAVRAMQDGATFVDVARWLSHDCGATTDEAVAVAVRAFRGADGTRPGLGRERVYLPSFLRVRAHLAAHPDDEEILASGQVSLEAVPLLRGFVTSRADRPAPSRRPPPPP